MERRIGIADVAAAAGVSTATVSRALSDPARVSAATRARVLEAVRVTGYRVNGAARALRARRARTVLVLLPHLENTFFSRIVAAVEEILGEEGLAVQVADTRMPAARLDAVGRDGRADAVILLDGGLDPALVRGWGVPVVMLCEWIEGDRDLPGVAIDNPGGMALAVAHLVGLGHRRIAFVGGPEGNVLSEARLAGFREAMATRGLPVRPGDLLPGDFTPASGVAAAAAWAGASDRASAVICASDECAMGFLSGCHARGLTVPEDVSVVGFDDVEFAAYAVPPLTTVHQPRAGLGREAARMLLDSLRGEPTAVAARRLQPHLVVRSSTSGPAARR
jgi:LacI family repressor for deo operon, udp, cdd, tsx, nupC, and nupG